VSSEIPTGKTPYTLIGGAQGVRALVERFYDYMDSLPEARGVRDLHARSLRASREKLYLFLSGWLGGPPLYARKHGHPMLRRRHLPFAIGRAERDQWLLCMDRALADMDLDPALRDGLREAFLRTAEHMRNRPEDPQTP
jgi:hemoglobin